MHYYKVFLPDGKTWRLETGNLEKRKQLAEELLKKWTPYCLNGWGKDDGDVYSPANKVKRFLNSLAYYLLFDDTEGIVTDYKEQATGKREIPISSCPEIEDALYSSATVPKTSHEQGWREDNTADDIVSATKKAKSRKETRWDRIRRFREKYPGSGSPVSHPVDTENKFLCNDGIYQIDLKLAPQYSADERGVYALDKIWSCDTLVGLVFFDQNFREMNPDSVKRIK